VLIAPGGGGEIKHQSKKFPEMRVCTSEGSAGKCCRAGTGAVFMISS